MSMTNIKVENYTNHLGQVIKPNDKIVAIANGASSTARLGTYLGTRNGKPTLIVYDKQVYNWRTRQKEDRVRRVTMQRGMVYPTV